jgi:hypothetical protein
MDPELRIALMVKGASRKISLKEAVPQKGTMWNSY